MADGSKIEWTDATWTPVKGCTRVSPGCGGPGPHGGCYAEIMAARFSKPGQWGEGLAKIVTLPDGSKDHRWTGVIRFDERELLKPLSWKKPRRIFVCSTADLFHDGVTDEQIDKVFAIMTLCPQHTFQVLTKRPERMRVWFERMAGTPQRWAADILSDAAYDMGVDENSCIAVANWINGFARWRHAPADDNPLDGSVMRWPLPNVWAGTSVEDQPRADERIPHLLATPAAVRFLSCEPLLGDLDLEDIRFAEGDGDYYGVNALTGSGHRADEDGNTDADPCEYPSIDWVICGGESGPGARPMDPAWVESIAAQCEDSDTPFFFKQWGEFLPDRIEASDPRSLTLPVGHVIYNRVGKKRAGRRLWGVEHNGMPA